MKYYDLNNCLVNLSNSILKHYTGYNFHPTLKILDESLSKTNKMILFLFDGLGKYILEKHLPEDSFLRRHYLTTIDSTFPPTTVAATTAVKSAKFPNETGWLAWSQRYKKENINSDVFLNRDSQSKIQLNIKDHNLRCPYKTINDLINEKYGNEVSFIVNPKHVTKKEGDPDTLDDLFKEAYKKILQKDSKYVYAYWPYPDTSIHTYGTKDDIVHQEILDINKKLEEYHEKYPQISIIIIADHGLIDTKYLNLEEHDDLAKLRDGYSFFEKRSVGFNIKKGKKTLFKNLFKKYYSNHFILYDKKQIIDKDFFGPKRFFKEEYKIYLPDFLAISKDEYSIYDFKDAQLLLGHHGGVSKEEFKIDVHFLKGKN